MTLVGREADLEVTVDFVLARARRPYPVLLVTGPPGIGKTALLEAVIPVAEQNGWRVLRSGAVEFEADLPYGGLNQLLLPLASDLPAISSTHREALEIVLGLRTGTPPSPLVVGAAVLALVDAGTGIPLLFVVDDSAFLDRVSAMAIAFVARRVDGSRVRFLLSARDDLDNPLVRSGFDVHPLGPLSEASADALLADRFPGLDRDARRRIRESAEGNPLALLDLPADDPGTAPLPDVAPLGERLRARYVEQLAELPAAVRRALLFVVLAGSETGAALARVLTADRGGDLAPAEQSDLVRVDPVGDRLEFRHPLVRTAVVESSTVEERRQAHAALAEAFRDDPRRRAWHLGESAVWPAPAVATELDELSDRLISAGDSRAATSAVLRAIELTEDRTDRVRRIGRAAYLQSAFAGDLAASEELLRQAHPDLTVPLPLFLVGAGAYTALSRDGDAFTVHRLLVVALDDVPGPLDAADDTTREVLHLLVLASYLAGQDDLWEATRRQLDRIGAPLSGTLAVLRGVYADAPRPDDAALRLLDDALGALLFMSDALEITRLATAGAHLDRGALSRGPLLRVLDDGRAGSGAVAQHLQSALVLGVDEWATGGWPALRARVAEGLELGEGRGYAFLTAIAHYLAGLVDAATGRDQEADHAVERLLQWAAPRGLRTVAEYASHIQCLRAIGREDFEEAYRYAASIGVPGTFSTTGITSYWTVFDLVEAAVRSGHDSEARAHVAAAVAAGLGAVSPRLALVVGGAAGLVATDDWDERYTAALSAPDGERYAFDHARVRLAYGERLRRERELVAARRELGVAAASFAQLGAVPWHTRAVRELRAAGGSAEPAGHALTPQETAVARLAAQGLTNKQIGVRLFLSPRTVSTHLSHVFGKLGVTSRRELVQAVPPSEDA